MKCQAKWPLTGHQCELDLGHEGHHHRIMSSDWLTWCDEPSGCSDPSCDLSEHEPSDYQHVQTCSDCQHLADPEEA